MNTVASRTNVEKREREPGAGVIIDSAGGGEDHNADLRITKDGELFGLLE